ncbi:dihydroorotate dehydrogenase electron transfer subunit [Jeotgalibacillus haloalkalitolerans]|uniref:Dihydroorotate dehydrogenase B (NAD(+)), electron transfer subunit n=1 Tax=Jeotgalibacillus haloalkalitolerans TaxID=3104292 RepID=A0ABU5KK03_9BACL|nr:dihydroorotate dehydrogenase electron transfer subunit [Jeotgalibacillus sp. HH7-29]MDZ5711592.1 dihydroorotate dehydrogenase electron transfer subunit [Jeotgalibacillus sp. HH7-29]
MIKVEKMKIIQQTEIAENIFKISLKGSLVNEISMPGQFVHIKVNTANDPLLRRPISISSYDKKNQIMTLIYRASGLGTRELANQSEEIDVMGPLGSGFPIEQAEGQTAILIGGGIGVPPLYECSKQLKNKGFNVIHVLGFETKDTVFYESAFKELGPVYITTADGSYGTKGFVTDAITEFDLKADVFFACGPVPMLGAVEKQLNHIPGYISMEQRMGCGIGACLACVCTVNGPELYKKVCTDGPVFRKGELVYG